MLQKITTGLIFSVERKTMIERISNPQKHRNPESNWKGRISEMKMEVCGRCGSKPD